MSESGASAELPDVILGQLVDLPQTEAIAILRDGGWWTVAVAMALAEWALEIAEVNATHASRALALATLISAEHGEPPMLSGQIAYADARRAVHAGDLAAAEAALLTAQRSWRSVDATVPAARTNLGLTQLLTMQGRYDEAATAARRAIDALQPFAAADGNVRLLLARAHRNLANLFVYQEQHAAARDAYEQARAELERFRSALSGAGSDRGLDAEFGHLALNLASAHTFLDAPEEAERLLQEAIAHFAAAQDTVNRGRAQANLGRLYLRLGEYAAALRAFDAAGSDLRVPSTSAAATGDAELEALRLADELLLEQALGYLALNLLPEAASALERCERLFRSTGQPYELAQCRYAQGILHLQQAQWVECQAAFDEALALYTQLDNPFWQNRTQTARARLALAQGDAATAAARLDELLSAGQMTTPTGAVAWDLAGLVEVWLLRLQLWLDDRALDDAATAAQRVAQLLGDVPETLTGSAVALPHFVLRLFHARARLAAARGEVGLARRHFATAVDLLDRQRGSLPLEEVRTAYLDDKMTLYSDLVLSLLAAPLPSDDEVAAAFAVVERARSRALLERLLASVDAEAGDEVGDESEAVRTQRAALRRQLHWLYNQLLGDSGNRRLDGALSREVAQHEAALQQLEWRHSPLLAQAEPVQLHELQEMLEAGQQALVYYFAGDEVMAFVVDAEGARVVRHLASLADISLAQTELRFQLGRAETGADYVARHHDRLLRGVQAALGRLYTLLVAPLAELLQAERLLLIPFGCLHLVPFHALWDGAGYWLERVEIVYAPSASIAVYQQANHAATGLRRFAGFAPYDERIPQAQAEIDLAGRAFAEVTNYHGDAATIEHLRAAAASVDVLHLATHGLFRPDNSFFSALKLADGWVDVREVYRLALRARLVTLSACESGVGEVRGGDEVVGLARGFLAAGAKHLIASLWNVHDSSAADLMGSFYKILQDSHNTQAAKNGANNGTNNGALTRPAAALRAAQVKALHSKEHPYYWAAFFAIG